MHPQTIDHQTEGGKKYFFAVAGEDSILVGSTVRWALVSEETGYEGRAVMLSDADTIPCGVACSAGNSGDVIRVQCGGLGDVDIITNGDNDIAAGNLLFAVASGVVDSSALAGDPATDIVLSTVGLALEDDGDTLVAAGGYVLFPFGAP